MSRYDNWISGKSVPPVSGTYLESRSPVNGEIVAHIALSAAADADAAVRAAADAQLDWRSRTPAQRGALLLRIAEGIRAEAAALATLETAETGKPNPALEIDIAAEYFTFYGSVIRAFHGEALDLGTGSMAYTRHEPYGVIAVITPWNGPLNQAARDVAPALATGNTVVLKPSEFTSTTSLALARIATACGLPDGVLNVVTGLGPEAGAALADHPAVRKIAFTGSVATGKRIGAAAAARVVPVTLELGGKSASIVFADANLDRAAPHVAAAFTANSGQVCSAGTRLLVERSVHDDVVDRVADLVQAMPVGVRIGPIITPAQYEKVQEYFAIATAEAATLRSGGGTATDGLLAAGQYVQPTIYTDVRPDMRIAQEEIFGPVLSVIPFDTEQEALEIANGVPFGLLAYLWTGDAGRALRMADRLDAGQVSVNGAVMGIETPFGGYKDSGIGRVKGVEALRTYTQLKTIGMSMAS